MPINLGDSFLLLLLLGLVISINAPLVSLQRRAEHVKVEFHLAQNSSAPGLVAAQINRDGAVETIYLYKAPIIEGRDIVEATCEESSVFRGKYAVKVTFTRDAAERMATTTENNLYKMLAVVVDGKVTSAVNILARVYDRGSLGPFSQEEAESLAEKLNAASEGRK